jgi:hypothetical protein
MEILPEAPSRGVLVFHRFNARNPIRVLCSGLLFRFNLRWLLLPRRLSGELEMPAVRRTVFQSCILSQPVWRQLLSLWPSQMVGVGEWNCHLPSEFSVRVDGDGSVPRTVALLMLPGPMEKPVTTGRSKVAIGMRVVVSSDVGATGCML